VFKSLNPVLDFSGRFSSSIFSLANCSFVLDFFVKGAEAQILIFCLDTTNCCTNITTLFVQFYQKSVLILFYFIVIIKEYRHRDKN